MFSYSSLLRTSEMLFETILMRVDVNDLIASDSILGPICFSLFIFSIIFPCSNIFISIFTDSFRFVSKQAIDHENLLLFMKKQFLSWMGWKKIDHEENDRQMRKKYFHPVKNFPDKID